MDYSGGKCIKPPCHGVGDAGMDVGLPGVLRPHLEAVAAVGHVDHLDVGAGRGECLPDFVRATEGIALALHHEQGHADGAEVRHAQLLRLARAGASG